MPMQQQQQQQQQQNRQSTGTPAPLDGDVFARHQRFMTLPKNLQEDAKQFRSYIEQDKSRLFQTHHHALVKSVYSVKGKYLIDTIIYWLQTHYASTQRGPAQVAPAPGFTAANADETRGVPSRAAPVQHPSPTREPVASALTPGSTRPTHVTKEQLHCAKQVAEALVLIGFITPYNDDSTHLSFHLPKYYVHNHDIDSELFIPVAPSVTELMTTSVWSVADGAVYARALKRKAGVLGQIDDGKDVYVVLNDYTKKTYLFASDLAREPIAEMSGSTMSVRYDNSHFQFGVRVCQSLGRESDKPELFNAETMERQEEFVTACLRIGAYDESGVKNTMEAESRGLAGREGVQGHQGGRQRQSNEPYEAATAGVAAATISGRESGNSYPTSSGEHQQHQYQSGDSYPTSASTEYQGNQGRGTSYPTSTGEQQYQKPS
ncbi:Phospholipid hydroperoxide glutathione, partial [Globisporangium polare]